MRNVFLNLIGENMNPQKAVIDWAANKPTEYQGKAQFNIKIKGEFYNCQENIEENSKILKKGNEIEFKANRNIISDIKLIKKAEVKLESNTVNIAGKDHMLYKGLLALAHKKDPEFSMEIIESFVNEEMSKAWCIVRLTTKLGKQVFDGFGSSTPENTGKMTESHPVEMCHTRAKGRALRDFVNIGVAMAEELKHDD